MVPTPIPYPKLAPVRGLTPLSANQMSQVAERLPVTPYAVIPYGGLRWGVDRAFLSGPPPGPNTLVVQHRSSPGEPEVIGPDAEAAWKILSRIPGWFCVNGRTREMQRLGPLLRRGIPGPVRWIGDVFFVLRRPPRPFSDPRVRLLGLEDLDLFPTDTPTPWAGGFRTYEELLTKGALAAAVVDGRIVAAANCTAWNRRFADIGVHTLEPYRRQGLSSAAVCLVARELQDRGLTPIWSTGSENLASQGVAAKLGFEPYGQGAYLVFESLRAAGGYRPT